MYYALTQCNLFVVFAHPIFNNKNKLSFVFP